MVDQRVVWTTKGLGLGGAEAILVDLAPSLTQMGVELVVFNLGAAGDHREVLEACGVQVVDMPQPLRLDRLALGLRRTRPDIVHVNNPATLPIVAAIRSARIADFRIVYTEHNIWSARRWLTRTVHRYSSKSADAVIAVSKAVSGSGVWRAEPPLVVHHGPPVTRPAPTAALEGDPKFLMIGGLRPNKDHLNAVRAFKAVLDRHPQARLHIAGEGQMRPSIETEIELLGLQGAVHLLGAVPSARSLLSPDVVFLQSSKAEGLPIAIREALAAGSPIVATNVGGTEEALTGIDGQLVGSLVPSGDAVALSKAMFAAAGGLSHSGDSGRELAELRQPSSTAARYRTVYSEVLSRG